jgi:hypothetical protein
MSQEGLGCVCVSLAVECCLIRPTLAEHCHGGYVQAGLFVVEAFPGHCDCLALANILAKSLGVNTAECAMVGPAACISSFTLAKEFLSMHARLSPNPRALLHCPCFSFLCCFGAHGSPL